MPPKWVDDLWILIVMFFCLVVLYGLGLGIVQLIKLF